MKYFSSVHCQKLDAGLHGRAADPNNCHRRLTAVAVLARIV